MLAAIKGTINSSSANKLRFEFHQRYFKPFTIKIHISEPPLKYTFIQSNTINIPLNVAHQRKKKSYNMSLHFPPRSMFLQKYRHVPSVPDTQLKRMVRYKEQEMLTRAIFSI